MEMGAAAALTFTGSGANHPAVRHTAAPVAAAATSQPAATFSPPPPPTPMEQWCQGSGGSDLQAVESDEVQLHTDSGNDNLLAVESDGSQLFTDAHAAGMNLPPGGKAEKLHYGLYMGWLMAGGTRPRLGT